MRKLTSLLLLVFLFTVSVGQEPLKQTVEQMKKEIIMLKDDIKQEKAQKKAEMNKRDDAISYEKSKKNSEMAQRDKTINFKESQIKDREKILKSINNYK